MNGQEITEWAGRLWKAEQKGLRIEKLSDRHPDATLEDAYRIQEETARLSLKAGETLAGYKIAFTSPVAMSGLGLAEPALGYMPAGQVRQSPWRETSGRVVTMEPELAVRIGRDLDRPGVAEQDVYQALDAVFPAIELIAPRFHPKDAKAVDFICDHVCFGGLVCGEERVPLPPDRIGMVHVSVEENGMVVGEGEATNVMGSPYQAVAWLANKLLSMGKLLKQGDLVLTGSFTPQLPVRSGGRYSASFTVYGEAVVEIK